LWVAGAEDIILFANRVPVDACGRGDSGRRNIDATNLILDDSRATDVGLRHLEGMTGLEELGLRGTRISDAGLVHLGRLSHLGSLGLGRISIDDCGLLYLKGLAGLKRLRSATLGSRSSPTHRCQDESPRVHAVDSRRSGQPGAEFG
jgi:hypothetical protein